jgi:hypothetical protein
VSRPTLLHHGHQGLFVPIGHGQWLSRAVPGAESGLLADEAHLSLLTNRLSGVHEWLLDRFASE